MVSNNRYLITPKLGCHTQILLLAEQQVYT